MRAATLAADHFWPLFRPTFSLKSPDSPQPQIGPRRAEKSSALGAPKTVAGATRDTGWPGRSFWSLFFSPRLLLLLLLLPCCSSSGHLMAILAGAYVTSAASPTEKQPLQMGRLCVAASRLCVWRRSGDDCTSGWSKHKEELKDELWRRRGSSFGGSLLVRRRRGRS